MPKSARTNCQRPPITERVAVTARDVLDLKAYLRRRNRAGRSWLSLSEKFPGAKPGTLQRFATEPDYIPQDLQVRLALHLSPFTQPGLAMLSIIHGGMGSHPLKKGRPVKQ